MSLTQLDILIDRLKDAQYAHLLLEPIPLFGIFFGLIFFAVGLWGKEDKTRVIALLIIVGACATVIPYTTYRERAQPRVLEVMPLKKAIKDQSALRRSAHWVYLTVGVTALTALIMTGSVGQLAEYGVLVTGMGALIFSVWLHMKEAEIFHPNIRGAPPKVIPATPGTSTLPAMRLAAPKSSPRMATPPQITQAPSRATAAQAAPAKPLPAPTQAQVQAQARTAPTPTQARPATAPAQTRIPLDSPPKEAVVPKSTSASATPVSASPVTILRR
ncbi:hypothetical protein [Verrucomicrobium sp. BvORR106]|uniref:hypothetical protein n=1 Tax=Verrucomicrobium sp. BvORR106 TaxID=1403819 RepID=UPI00056F304F|nr:hypothetical protein [Verrucomicrobium sp. BvORR106]